jgi:chromosomal replication initiator protein
MIRIADIQRAVIHNFRVPEQLFFSPCREKFVAHPRQVAMLLAREFTPHSLTVLGKSFGRDHTTVLHGIGAAQKRLADDADLARKVSSIRHVLKANQSTTFGFRSVADFCRMGA